MMTRKDFVALAEALLSAEASLATVKAVAEVCRVHGGFTANGNRRFDADWFYTACGHDVVIDSPGSVFDGYVVPGKKATKEESVLEVLERKQREGHVAFVRRLAP